MTYTVICYEITLEKCINVSVVEVLGEVMVVIDLFLLGCIGSDDCNVYLLAFKLSTLY